MLELAYSSIPYQALILNMEYFGDVFRTYWNCKLKKPKTLTEIGFLNRSGTAAERQIVATHDPEGTTLVDRMADKKVVCRNCADLTR